MKSWNAGSRPKVEQTMRVTKQMLGNQTRKKLLYLDQNLFSLAAKARRHAWVDEVLERITELLDL